MWSCEEVSPDTGKAHINTWRSCCLHSPCSALYRICIDLQYVALCWDIYDRHRGEIFSSSLYVGWVITVSMLYVCMFCESQTWNIVLTRDLYLADLHQCISAYSIVFACCRGCGTAAPSDIASFSETWHTFNNSRPLWIDHCVNAIKEYDTCWDFNLTSFYFTVFAIFIGVAQNLVVFLSEWHYTI